MKRIFATLAAPLAMTTAIPAIAQEAENDPPLQIKTVAINDDETSDEETMAGFESVMGGLFGDAFKAEPLTPEQEALIPQADLVVAKLFPEGTFLKVMETSLQPMMDGFMGGMFGGMGEYPTAQIAALAGMETFDVAELDDAVLKEAGAIIDPNHQARKAAFIDVSMDLAKELVVRIEPAYRAGMSRAYAQRFTSAEMTELDRFFATPVGAHYAAESMLIFSDPQVMSAMNEMVPVMMELLPGMMGNLEELGEKYPEAKPFAELSGAEQDRLSTLLGVSKEKLAENAEDMTPSFEIEEYEDDYDPVDDVAEVAVEPAD